MKEKLTQYFNPFEFKSIIIPGGYVVSFLLITHPSLESFIRTITFGGFALFVFLSFVLGHLINSLSYFLEKIFWGCFGGMPTDWLFGSKRIKKKLDKVLTDNQTQQLDDFILKKLSIPPQSISSCECRAVVHELRLCIPIDKIHRLEEHNTSYCLHRALSTASASLAFYFFIIYGWYGLKSGGALIFCSSLFLYRMYKFGIYYARELFLQFINTHNLKRK